MTQSRYPLRLSKTVRHASNPLDSFVLAQGPDCQAESLASDACLREEAARYAKKEHTSLNSFIEIAVAERLAALKTTEFFAERGRLADRTSFRQFLSRKGQGEPLRAGDEVPEGIDFIRALQEDREGVTEG
jgi:hypothetical protein